MSTELRILHISDPQFGNLCMAKPTSDPDSVVEHPVITTFLKACSKTEPPDVIVLSGDITSVAAPSEFVQADAFMRELSAAWGTEVPYLFIPGNHDLSWAVSELETPNYTSLRFASYIAAAHEKHPFSTHWPAPLRNPGLVSHSLRNGKVHVVGLNTALNDDYDKQPHHGSIVAEHTDYLKQELENTTASYRVVAIHHHLRPPKDPAEWSDTSVATGAESLLHALSSLEIDIVLHGHRHQLLSFRETKDNWQAHVFGAGSMSVVPSHRGGGYVLPNASFIDIHGRHEGVAYGQRHTLFMHGTAGSPEWKLGGRHGRGALERFGPAVTPGTLSRVLSEVLSEVPQTSVVNIGSLLNESIDLYGISDEKLREVVESELTSLEFELMNRTEDRQSWKAVRS